MRPALEVADVFRRHGAAFLRDHAAHLGRVERRVITAIQACRTSALGGHVEECGDCGLVRHAYNSCRNRHCPKCQGLARAEWLEARQAELLPVPYYHVVLTLPAAAAEIAFQNKRVVYAILFRAAADALRDIAADPRHLGAEIGAVAVLHTWGQACTTTRICTALSRAAACRRIRQVGSPVGQDSSCLCASSRGGSAGCSSDGYKRRSRLANCASPVCSRL
jgi:hypothetical protein